MGEGERWSDQKKKKGIEGRKKERENNRWKGINSGTEGVREKDTVLMVDKKGTL